MNLIIKFFSIVMILFFLCSCQGRAKREVTYILLFDVNESSMGKPFFRDSLLITNYSDDSILIKNYYNGNFYENIYFNQCGDFYEKRYVANLPDNFFGIDSILTFTLKDTTLIYRTKRDNFIVTLIDLSLFDSQYTTSKDGDNYKTIKQSLVDTTYKEIFFYNKDYHIYKYINFWKKNKCVYMSKDCLTL